MNITDEGARALGSAIVLRACEDYFLCQEVKDGKRSASSLPSYVNVRDLGRFFRSDLCANILQGLGKGFENLNQKDIMPKLARLYISGQYKLIRLERILYNKKEEEDEGI